MIGWLQAQEQQEASRKLTIEEYEDKSGKSLNAFLNSLFDPWPGPFAKQPGNLFRAGLVQRIKAAEKKGELVSPKCWLIDNATINLIVGILQGYWSNAFRLKSAPRVIETDKAFIELVRNYIDTYNLQLVVPNFSCSKKENDLPSAYKLEKSTVLDFKKNKEWDPEVVREFLELLLVGAHFVVVHSRTDTGLDEAPESFFSLFCKLNGAGKAGHSHYTGHKVSLNGRNYPELALNEEEGKDLDKLLDPSQAALLPVVLCDTTSNQDPNSFFQMEGWRPGKSMLGVWEYEYRFPALAGGYRHGADFDTHGKTIWNISTYGASPFSEKRGGMVFLAPKEWIKKGKVIYQGFGGPANNHSWFKKDLVEGL